MNSRSVAVRSPALGWPAVIVVAIPMLVIVAWVGPEIAFTAGSIGILLFLARDNVERYAAVAVPLLGRLLLALGWFHFEPPDQVVDLAARGVDPFVLILQNHIWWPRYLLTYPAVALMDEGIRLERGFALYNAALLPCTVFALYRAARAVTALGRRSRPFGHVTLIVLTILVFMLGSRMNGRLIFAHLGMAILLATQTAAIARSRIDLATWGLTVMAFVMGQMSTGAGAVVAGQILIGMLLIGRHLHRIRDTAAELALFFAIVGPFLLRSEMKTVTFFGGGAGAIPGLLHHGAAGYLLDRPALLVLAILAAVGLGVGVLAFVRSRRIYPIRSEWLPIMFAVPLSLVGGMFGYSTMTMAFPPLFVLASAACVDWLDKSGHALRAPSQATT